MKYHYQLVSKSKVRIELIPEDKAESQLLVTLTHDQKQSKEEILAYFNSGIEAYSTGAKPMKIAFMQFPKVALCSFTEAKPVVELNSVSDIYQHSLV